VIDEPHGGPQRALAGGTAMPGPREIDPVKKVMLVDDDDDVRLIAQMALRDVGGWPTIAVSSGRLAVALAPTERPDVILLDVMMPDLDGPSVLRQMRMDPVTATIPVIFMTAKARPSEAERFIAVGAAGVITKPFDPMTLAAQVREIVRQYHATRAGAHV
jgi:two-component system OmpR family response regulator